MTDANDAIPLIPSIPSIPFVRACQMMGTSEKVVRKWLREERIASTTSVDARLRLYARADLERIAAKHGRTLRDDPLPKEASHRETRESLEARLTALEAEIAALRTARVPMVQAVPTVPELSLERPRVPVAMETLVRIPTPTRPLVHPLRHDEVSLAGLISVEEWGRIHRVHISTIKKAIDTGRQPVTRGHWKQGRAIVNLAFTPNEQHEAWRNWHYLPRFLSCPQCPHDSHLVTITPLEEARDTR